MLIRRNGNIPDSVFTNVMLTHLTVTALRIYLSREDGDTMSQVVWSVGFILLVGVIAVVIGPKIGADWREFVGKPTK
jgi:hypothetical protein